MIDRVSNREGWRIPSIKDECMKRTLSLISILVFLVSVSLQLPAAPARETGTSTQTEAPMAQSNIPNKENLEQATVGGGCFWCVEAVMERLDGVEAVVSGYAGGRTENPTYEEVCTGRTGHAEVVQIYYDPEKTSYGDILDMFFKAHDPTQLNRQGADVGTQYRSIILYQNDEQQRIAEKSKRKAQAERTREVVTEVAPLETFYAAEDYHQDYYDKNPTAGYCSFVIRPKLDKLGMDS
jgi:peptide-methionine (S)-S-oxide reductase